MISVQDRHSIARFLESGEVDERIVDLALTGHLGPDPLDLLRRLDVARGARQCSVCGCTDQYACPLGCGWVSERFDVCTSCMDAVVR